MTEVISRQGKYRMSPEHLTVPEGKEVLKRKKKKVRGIPGPTVRSFQSQTNLGTKINNVVLDYNLKCK